MKDKYIKVILIVCVFLIGFVLGMVVGDNLEEKDSTDNSIIQDDFEQKSDVTFTATIKELYDGSILVSGDKDENSNYIYESEFTFGTKDLKITKDGKEILVNDLKVGDHIMVIFDGVIQETYPAQLPNVKEIRIIE